MDAKPKFVQVGKEEMSLAPNFKKRRKEKEKENARGASRGAGVQCRDANGCFQLHRHCSSSSAAPSNPLNVMPQIKVVTQNNHLGDYKLILEMPEPLTALGIPVEEFSSESGYTRTSFLYFILVSNFGLISFYKAVKQGTSQQDSPTCLGIN